MSDVIEYPLQALAVDLPLEEESRIRLEVAGELSDGVVVGVRVDLDLHVLAVPFAFFLLCDLVDEILFDDHLATLSMDEGRVEVEVENSLGRVKKVGSFLPSNRQLSSSNKTQSSHRPQYN